MQVALLVLLHMLTTVLKLVDPTSTLAVLGPGAGNWRGISCLVEIVGGV